MVLLVSVWDPELRRIPTRGLLLEKKGFKEPHSCCIAPFSKHTLAVKNVWFKQVCLQTGFQSKTGTRRQDHYILNTNVGNKIINSLHGPQVWSFERNACDSKLLFHFKAWYLVLMYTVFKVISLPSLLTGNQLHMHLLCHFISAQQ